MGRNIDNISTVPTPNRDDKLVGSQTITGKTYNWTISQILSLLESADTYTRQQILNLISNNELVQSSSYIITDANSGGNTIIVTAGSSNELFGLCINQGDLSVFYNYNINSDELTPFSSGGASNVLTEAEVRAGNSMMFKEGDPETINVIGAFYHPESPSDISSVNLDLESAKIGFVCAWFNDGSVEPVFNIVNGTANINPVGGEFEAGQVNVYYFMWDGTRFQRNILTTPSTPLPKLATPTLIITPKDASVDYTISNEDANSTGGVMEISSDNSTFYPVTGAEYTFPSTTGTVTDINGSPLVNETLYYVRFKNTAIGTHQDSDFSLETATPSAGVPVLFQDDFTGVTIDPLKWTVVNPNPTAVEIKQNNALILDSTAVVSGAPFANKILSVTNFDLSNQLVIRFDASRNALDSSTTLFGLGDGTDANYVALNRRPGEDNAQFIVRESSVSTGNFVTNQPYAQSYKIVKASNGDCSLHRWNVSSWTQLGTTIGSSLTSGNLIVFSSMQVNIGEVIEYQFDNLFVTNQDYATLNP